MRRVLLAGLVLAVTLGGCLDPAANAWAVAATQLDDLRADAGPARTIRVAILDSGIDVGHPSLAHLDNGRLGDGELVLYQDFLGDGRAPRDHDGHGTFVSGVLAASPPAGLAAVAQTDAALRGLVPDVELLVGRVCSDAICDPLAVWKGIEWAVTNKADVVSLSLGFTPTSLAGREGLAEDMRFALERAESAGVLVVAAAGNTEGPVLFPAREPTVLAVGAMDRDRQPRGSSARGYGSTKPDLLAPGEGIVGPDLHDGRRVLHGTSVAVPFVVAAAALMMHAGGDPEDAAGLALLRKALIETAQPLDGQRMPHDPWAGHGLLQAGDAAVRYAELVDAREAAEAEDGDAASSNGNGHATTPSPLATFGVATAWSTTS